MNIFVQYSVAEMTAKKLRFPGKNAGKNTGKRSIGTQCICAGRKPAKGKGRVNSEFPQFSKGSFHGLGKCSLAKLLLAQCGRDPTLSLGREVHYTASSYAFTCIS